MFRKINKYLKKDIHFVDVLSFLAKRGIRFSAEKPVRGSDSSPDCHSTPLTSNPFYFITKEKRQPLLWISFSFWRRERDSNPRTGISRYTISNRAPSTNSAISPQYSIPLQDVIIAHNFFSVVFKYL